MTIMSEKPTAVAKASTTADVTSSALKSLNPASEALLNEKWDRCLSSLFIRSTLGLSFGVVFSVLLFRRRAWPAWVGLGFGAGRAWEECDNSFKAASSSQSRAGTARATIFP